MRASSINKPKYISVLICKYEPRRKVFVPKKKKMPKQKTRKFECQRECKFKKYTYTYICIYYVHKTRKRKYHKEM